MENRPKIAKVVFPCFSERCHGNMCNLNVIVVLEFINRDLYLLLVILLSSKFQNSIFHHHIRPKSGLKFPRPFYRNKHHIFLKSSVTTKKTLYYYMNETIMSVTENVAVFLFK